MTRQGHLAIAALALEGQAASAMPIAPRFIDVLAAEEAEPDLRKGERTRRRVLWATAVALAETSFAQLNMDLIAQAAEVSRAALYQYVGSKEEAVRTVLTDFQSRTLAIPLAAMRTANLAETILRTNRYYIDYFANNAAFMERVRELHQIMPELTAEKQRVNREWADRLVRSATRRGAADLLPERLRIRAFLMECMIDDVLREIFVIANPDLREAARDLDLLAEEITRVWLKALYEA
jgi:AcrR family transcriptional regulator